MRYGIAAAGLCALALTATTPAAFGHAERPSYYPNWDISAHKYDPAPEIGPGGAPPKYRNKGPALVVCKADSKQRIKALPRKTKAQRAMRNRNLRYLRNCRFRHIQQAVNAAPANNGRILVLPGVYKEEPSRASPNPDPPISPTLICRLVMMMPANLPAAGEGEKVG